MKRILALVYVCISCTTYALDSPDEVIHQLIEGNYAKESAYKARTLYQITPDFFTELRSDVLRLIQKETSSNVTEKKHATNWTHPQGTSRQFSLLNTSGRFNDYSSDHIKSKKGKRFHHGQKYPALARFIHNFPDAINFRLNLFGAQSGLKQHREDITLRNPCNEPILRVRFHLPIVTNEEVSMFVAGNYYHFQEGTLYFFHNGTVHAAYNRHPTDARLHLVWDMLLTKDTYDRLFAGTINDSAFQFLGNIPTESIRKGQKVAHPSMRGNVSYEEAQTIWLCDPQ